MKSGRAYQRDAAKDWERDDVDLLDTFDMVARHSLDRLTRLFGRLDSVQLATLEAAWWQWSLPAQRAPAGDWRVWLVRAGRGFGKTRAGAEWVSEVARSDGGARIALVGHTMSDVRKVMVEGEAGLISVAREGETVQFRPTQGVVRFSSGAEARLFSAEAPEALRGPTHCHAWCDELGKWDGDAGLRAWDNLILTMRHGPGPHRVMVTTTPRTTELMKKVMATADHETKGKTADNPHLSAHFVAAMIAEYGGTRLGRQELDGEYFEDAEAALWSRDGIEACRVAVAPDRSDLLRVVVAVDPPGGVDGDACGIVAAGLGADGRFHVLEDASVRGVTPERWAAAVADCAGHWMADCVVAEGNVGGALVRSVLKANDRALPVKIVYARHGKSVRAEPVSSLYPQGMVRHCGRFPKLEDEMCAMRINGRYEGAGRSPDRADALVWAITELQGGRAPGVTAL